MRRVTPLLFAAPVIAVLGLAIPTASHAQDAGVVLGSWEMTMETPRGQITQVFTFVDGDEGLTGTVSTPRGETELQSVAFSEGVLTFEVVRNFRGNAMTQSFEAHVEPQEMTGTMKGGRGGGRDFKAHKKQP